LAAFVVGAGIYLFGLAWFGLVEVIFFAIRGGAQ
jgi:hypothetical protein